MSDPLARTLELVGGDDGHLTVVPGPPAGDGWLRVDEVLAGPEIVSRWLDALLADVADGHRDVAGAYLAGWTGEALAVPLARAIAEHGRGWPVSAELLWLREGQSDVVVDGLAVGGPLRVASTDDEARRARIETLPDAQALQALVLDELVALLTDLFAVIRRRVPFGVRGMWGSIADAVASDATWRAHVEGRDVDAAWDGVQPFLDGLDHRLPWPLVRPRLGEARWEGATERLTVRGTCCLYFKTVADGGCCTSCPLGTADDQAARLDAWLGRELAERARSTYTSGQG